MLVSAYAPVTSGPGYLAPSSELCRHLHGCAYTHTQTYIHTIKSTSFKAHFFLFTLPYLCLWPCLFLLYTFCGWCDSCVMRSPYIPVSPRSTPVQLGPSGSIYTTETGRLHRLACTPRRLLTGAAPHRSHHKAQSQKPAFMISCV